MKINIPPSNQLPSYSDATKRKMQIYELAMKFLNGTVHSEIMIRKNQGNAKMLWVNVQIPYDAYNIDGCYSSLEEFVETCKQILTPLGYKTELSHDGGGMYATLAVGWETELANPKRNIK